MKALVLEEYNQLVYKDMPDPVMAENEVMVRVRAVGICGSDVHGMDGSTGRRIPPLIMGHEAAGEIVEVGKSVTDWKVGDRVTFDSTIYRLNDWYTRQGHYNLSNDRVVLGVSPGEYRRHGAFAELVNIPQHILYKIPDSVSYTQAAMVEPVAVALHALSLTPVSVNDTAVVVGAGMIGLFLVQAANISGCGTVIALDIDSNKRKMAKELGATITLDPQKEDPLERVHALTNGRGTDIALEAVGITETVRTAVELVRKGGTVTLVGNLSSHIDFPLQSVVTRQIRVQGSCAICGEYPAALALIAKRKIHVDALISAEAPLSEGAEWFKKLYGKEKGLVKVILKP